LEEGEIGKQSGEKRNQIGENFEEAENEKDSKVSWKEEFINYPEHYFLLLGYITIVIILSRFKALVGIIRSYTFPQNWI
jgi:hypothetical protein